MKQASEGPAAGAAWRFRFTLPPSLPQPPVRGIGRGKPPSGPGKFFRFPSRLFSSSSSSPWRLPTCALGQSVSVGPAPSPWPRVGAGPPPPPRGVSVLCQEAGGPRPDPVAVVLICAASYSKETTDYGSTQILDPTTYTLDFLEALLRRASSSSSLATNGGGA